MPRRRRPPRPGALTDLSPPKLLRQILLLQTLYYTIATTLILFTSLIFGQPLTISLVLDWRLLRSDITTGWTLALCWLLTSLLTVIPIILFVARSKLVPDFAGTVHGVHFVVVTFWTGGRVPSWWFWWGLMGGSLGLMCGLGIWGCRWRELRPMAFGGRAKDAGVNGRPREEEDGVGHVMGVGGSASGGGSYEMVGLGGSREAG